MEIKEALKKEIKAEQRMLDRIFDNQKETQDQYALWCRTDHGRKNFYIRKAGEKKAKHVSRSKLGQLECIYQRKFDDITVGILEKNIKIMNRALKDISSWVPADVEALMPRAYREFKEILSSRGCFEEKSDTSLIHSSENPKNREALVYKARCGVYVRSKNEMLILDGLSMTGLEIWYEKRLELVTGGSDGYNTETVYPDFTVKLPDGSIIYWEHMGLMDQEQYQKANSYKLKLYFENGIYPPKNLILTMDGETMPFDSSAVWKIIDGFLLYGA